MNGAQIIIDVRGLTKDPSPGARWTDAQLMGYIADGVRYLQTRHAESRVDEDGVLMGILSGTPASNADLPLGDLYYAPLLAYACARCFETDAGNERDLKLAQMHREIMADFFRPTGD